MTDDQPDCEELSALDDLIGVLRDTPPLSVERELEIYEPYSKEVVSRMLSTGRLYGEVSGSPNAALFTPDEVEFRERLRTIDNNLAEQVEIVAAAVNFYFRHGEIPAPYYAWRIAVILRKRKEYQREADFLAGFAKHFCRGGGAKYIKISDRVPKAKKLAKKAARL